MSVVGRILGVLAGLALLSVALGGLWLLWVDQAPRISTGGVDLSLQLAIGETARWVATAVLAAAGLVGLGLLFESLRPHRRRLIELYAGEHESVLIAPDELERQLETVALDSERVSEAHAEVHASGNRSVAVDMSLRVEPEAEVGSVIADVQQRMAAALAARYGISLNRKPRIEVRYAREREQRPRHRRVAPEGGDQQAKGTDEAATMRQ